MAGLKPMFTMKGVAAAMEKKQKDYEQKVVKALLHKGEQFIRKVRSLDTYTDRTVNLRSSTGYILLKNGKEINSAFEGKQEGAVQGRVIAQRVARQYPKGIVLIGVAGMHYAAAVEAKGYDVISGSTPESQEMKTLLNAIKF